jgi:hemin uptake protein HemP
MTDPLEPHTPAQTTPLPPASPPAGRSEGVAAGRTLKSEEILAGHREVLILHQGEVYRLRVTRRGKLILQK